MDPHWQYTISRITQKNVLTNLLVVQKGGWLDPIHLSWWADKWIAHQEENLQRKKENTKASASF